MSVDERCQECKMMVFANEYHPYAACVLYKQLGQADKVRSCLDSVLEYARRTSVNGGEVKPEKESGEMQKTAPSLSESTVAKDSSENAGRTTARGIALAYSGLTAAAGGTFPAVDSLTKAIDDALTAARDSERARIRAAILSRAREVRKGASFLNQSFRLADILSFIDADPITQAGASASALAQNVESQVSVSASPECKAEGCNEPAKNCEYCERHHLSLCGQLHHRLITVPDASSSGSGSESSGSSEASVTCPRCGGDGGDRYECGLCCGQGKVTEQRAAQWKESHGN